MDDTSEQVIRIVSEQLEVDKKKVTPEKAFTEDLGADQLDIVEIIMSLEEEFNIDISCEDAESITTVGQAIDYLKNRGLSTTAKLKT